MKNHIVLSFALIVMVSCGGQVEKTTLKQKNTPKIETTPTQAIFVTRDVPQEIIQRGTEASNKLLKTLKLQLVAAMQEQGLKGALTFCSSRAQKLTRDVNLSYQGVLTIKRTSLKFRNPADKPDQFEDQALHLLQKNLSAGGTVPDYLIQKLSENGHTRYRYYKPLLINSACIGCHGDEKKMKPEILRKIRKTYPNGTATGYVNGQLRGVVRVEMDASAVTPAN